MSSLLELAERVEALSGPDRETDAAIARLFSHDVESDDGDFWFGPYDALPVRVPDYTGSLDAAMTLCQPDENRWPQLEYISPNPNNLKVGHRAWLWTKNGRPSRGNSMASAALAVCAAALRARSL